MLVIDAAVWPSGKSAGSESIGRIAIGQVSVSAGGDYADYLVAEIDGSGQTTRARVLRRRHVMAGWRDLLWAALDGDAAEPVAVDDPQVARIVAKVREGVSPPA
ncbi:hypothetical protein K8W59_19520 [Nocardioides rotundus]|uniref:hypothetical protein n=1 Tax=Nocardioides rotundus TaxID=1774216 RepID=UPI001CBC1889|nr:hypothetical protein [Nocardioides rotundus]UAL29880.1 hypothetical protein K8W59_19520 [Nocardioides rotundus]